jgi:SAM-dependent methyltransferase
MTGQFAEIALTSPAVAHNRAPILVVLRRILPADGSVLEIASGSGEHAVHFATALSHLSWQPTDVDPQALASIAAHRAAARPPNLLPPIALDAVSADWPLAKADAIVSINMIHIAPWSAAQGLMAGAERTLTADGVLYLYGPFKENGQHTAPSNASFDASLKRRHPEWGVRDVEDVCELARRHGMALVERVPMPVNNLSLVFRAARREATLK